MKRFVPALIFNRFIDLPFSEKYLLSASYDTFKKISAAASTESGADLKTVLEVFPAEHSDLYPLKIIRR